jgi:hypothetical protein
MGSIPLAALSVQPPAQPPNALDQASKIVQLRSLMQNQPLQQQALQQQVQAGGLGIQQQQQDLAARQALNQAYAGAMTTDSNGQATLDPNKLQQALASGPAAYQTPSVMKNIVDFQKSSVDLQTARADLQAKQADMEGSAAAAVKAAGYDPALAHIVFDSLPQTPQLQQIRQQIDNPQALKQIVDAAIQASPKQRELGAADTTAQARATEANTGAQRLNAQMNPQSSLYDPSQASIALGTAPGAQQIQQNRIQTAAQTAGAEESARMPGEMALAAQRQALSQGDPMAAARLLVSGDATLSELKARGATPEYIQQALNGAHQLSNGQYNAQQAEAQYEVAKSPTNTAVFQSVKSLTAPGGTLDQIQAAAKDIPQGQIPALNSIADWTKAATGNGPMAKYAALAVGAADDYSKVMGGGTGSDSSRQAALNLFKANMSPEARQGTIDGVRGAVNSQWASRIGQNPVMQRMYGQGLPGAQGGNQPPGPTPQTHVFNLSAWKAANPKGDAKAAEAAAKKQGYTVTQ